MLLKLLNPYFFNKYASRLIPYLVIAFVIILPIGLYYSLFASPEDYQQGEMVRIMYIHVPCAWLSLMIFFAMGVFSVISLIYRSIFCFIISLAIAPIGACFALCTLITGSIWGKPIWGAWWVWDARLTSMLILFIFYCCYLLIANASENIYRIEKPASVIAILGMINVPIVKFSVNMWYSLHQPASILRSEGIAIAPEMLKPLILMFIANLLLVKILAILRIKIIMNRLAK